MKGWEKTYLDNSFGTSLAVQWLRLQAPSAGDTGLIPGWRTKILHATLRVHLSQLKIPLQQRWKILCITTKTWRSSINKYFSKRN